MLWGYFKKLVIADRIDIFISKAYADYRSAGAVVLGFSILLDVVYIYADFSGCMDIARGVSSIFGVELDLNFNHPFSSLNIVEFWRRWHMSLGSWFKDYVYFPISSSRLVKNISKKTRGKTSPRVSKILITVVPVFCTWVLTGVWHGTGITYVAWGLYYSFMIFMSVTFEDDFKALNKKLKLNTESDAFRYFRMARTTLIFAGGRLLTRPGTLIQSAVIVKKLFVAFDPWSIFNDHLLDYGLDEKDMAIAAISIAIFGLVAFLQKRGEVSVRDIIGNLSLPSRWIITLLLLFVILIFGVYGPGYNASSFVYMAY
jgi:D-alanyl-lipoteichoic acid acyltransferase DltB (MBOAT superfamily)